MQSVLLDALVDPSRKTGKALDALLATSFAHFIDSSSLALVRLSLFLPDFELTDVSRLSPFWIVDFESDQRTSSEKRLRLSEIWLPSPTPRISSPTSPSSFLYSETSSSTPFPKLDPPPRNHLEDWSSDWERITSPILSTRYSSSYDHHRVESISKELLKVCRRYSLDLERIDSKDCSPRFSPIPPVLARTFEKVTSRSSSSFLLRSEIDSRRIWVELFNRFSAVWPTTRITFGRLR